MIHKLFSGCSCYSFSNTSHIYSRRFPIQLRPPYHFITCTRKKITFICTQTSHLSPSLRRHLRHRHTLTASLFHDHFGHETTCNPHNNRRLGFTSFVFPFGALQIFKATPTTDREHYGRMGTPFFMPSSLTRLQTSSQAPLRHLSDDTVVEHSSLHAPNLRRSDSSRTAEGLPVWIGAEIV